MTYQETLDFLYSRLPVFHQIGGRAFKPGLDTTIALCRDLGDPQTKYPCIHVGGTNGKGSTSHMIASILQEAGYEVGLYTSPHLKSFTERIRINGKEIEEDYIVEFVSESLSNIDRYEPSFFELTVSMAFAYFAYSEVDIAVIEVGMGGRLDSTNIINPVLSVITNVSYDHTQFLGDTLAKIASEKAGIIKAETPVVVSEYQDTEISNEFDEWARIHNSPIEYGSLKYSVSNYEFTDGKLLLQVQDANSGVVLWKDLILDLAGIYQIRNICGVLTAVDTLRLGGYKIDDTSVRAGVGKVSKNTGLKGRWQKLNEKPLVYCDTAHNYAGLSETIAQFISQQSTQMRFVIGFVRDKDIFGILGLFPKNGIFYFCQPSNLRALPAQELGHAALETGLNGFVLPDVNEALRTAISDSQETDTVYVGGSTFVVADLNQL